MAMCSSSSARPLHARKPRQADPSRPSRVCNPLRKSGRCDTELLRQLALDDQAQGHRLSMGQLVTGDLFQGVGHGVAGVEDGAPSRFALVFAYHLGLDLHAAPDEAGERLGQTAPQQVSSALASIHSK